MALAQTPMHKMLQAKTETIRRALRYIRTLPSHLYTKYWRLRTNLTIRRNTSLRWYPAQGYYRTTISVPKDWTGTINVNHAVINIYADDGVPIYLNGFPVKLPTKTDPGYLHAEN
jgi:hypothetical protein